MPYQSYLANVNAVLSSRDDANGFRSVLACIEADTVAQVMSFMSDESVVQVLHTLCATSPVARLNAEILAAESDPFTLRNSIEEKDRQLWYLIYQNTPFSTSEGNARSMWWTQRCGLPLQVYLNSAHADLLKWLLRNVASDQVKGLHLKVGEERYLMSDGNEFQKRSCDDLLSVIASVPSIKQISIASTEYIDELCDSASRTSSTDVEKLLRAAAQMHIDELALDSCLMMSDLSSFIGFTHLKKLTVHSCQLTELAGVALLPSLRELDVSGNQFLQRLGGLAGAPHLKRLTAVCCDLRSLENISSCPALKELNVVYNKKLSDLTGLSGAPELECFAAASCALRNLEPLQHCPALQTVNVSGNWEISDVSCLTTLECLKVLNLRGCNVVELPMFHSSVSVKR